jgi:hypothetical protein
MMRGKQQEQQQKKPFESNQGFRNGVNGTKENCQFTSCSGPGIRQNRTIRICLEVTLSAAQFKHLQR